MPSWRIAGYIAPEIISASNSASNTWQARFASSGAIHNVVLASEDVCDTINTLMPAFVSEPKIRLFTPMTPTIAIPLTVTMLVSLIEDMPRIKLLDGLALRCMTLPFASGRKVFLI